MMDRNNSIIEGTFDRQMDRKQFLVYVGTLIVAVAGIAGLWERMNNAIQKRQKTKIARNFEDHVERPFGSGPYGI